MIFCTALAGSRLDANFRSCWINIGCNSTLSVSKGFGFITTADGEQIELEDECFKDPQNQRVVLVVRDLNPNKIEEKEEEDRGFDSEFGVQFARSFSVVGSTIVKLDGSTAASAQVPRGPAGVFTIDSTFESIFSDSF